MTELTRDEIQEALRPTLDILREAGDVRPLAQYIVDLVHMRTEKLRERISELEEALRKNGERSS